MKSATAEILRNALHNKQFLKLTNCGVAEMTVDTLSPRS